MVNEIISWASKKNERIFIMKVDFEKAFDSLNWSFLEHTMEQMGFSQKWRKWINGCLDSSFGSVLVNGSPTKEFKIQKGLRQHDLLSRFIFIIAVEALHISLQEAKLKLFLKELKSVIIKLTSLTYNLRMMHLYWVLGLSKMQRTYVASLDVFNCRRV